MSRKPSASKKPSSSNSDKARLNRQQASQKKYVAQQKATKPPKSSYTTKDGKTVNVRKDSKTVESIRSRSSDYHTPAARESRMDVHFHNHGYSHPYSYYYGQPYYHVGGGYSSAFWWMMMEWSAERRARWLYHNQHNIESSAYQRGLQDAQVAAQIKQMEAQNLQRNADYIDPEFTENPSDMYSQEYIEAAYNPTVAPASTGSGVGKFLMWVFLLTLILVGGYLILTRVRLGK